MKKLILIITTMGIVSLLACPSIADDYSFRKTRWGMSIEEVKKSEPLEVMSESETVLGYKSKVIDKEVFILYIFADSQLVRARYALAESHTNKNDFITDYEDFKAILEKKYGNPKEDKSFWKNDLYKDDYSHWGTAISIGHLVYYSTWETIDTEIGNMLMGENYTISCLVEYTSKNLKDLEKKAKEKKAMDSF